MTTPFGLMEAVLQIKLCFSTGGFQLHLEGINGWMALGALNALLKMTGAEAFPTFPAFEVFWADATTVPIQIVRQSWVMDLLMALKLVIVMGHTHIFQP